MLRLIIYQVLQLLLLALLARLILDYIRMFKHDWMPRGVVLWFAEIIYTITDKPLSFFRRFMPPIRFGGVALDVSFIALFVAIQVLQRLVLALL